MSTAASSPYRRRVIEQVERVPEEYLPALARVVDAFSDSVSLAPAEESVRRGWEEAQRGDILPISELWEGMEDE